RAPLSRPFPYTTLFRSHALHHTFSQALRVLRPFYRHGLRARHIAEQHRRLDTARTIRLHPAVLREREAVQLLAEIFDHVVTLKLDRKSTRLNSSHVKIS